MKKGIKSKLIPTAIATMGLGILAYWYFLASYYDYHLFMNTYSDRPFEKWHWRWDPMPITDDDGTKVFVDFSKNELAVVFDTMKISGFNVAGYDGTGLCIVLEKRGVTIPESPNRCVFVDEYGVRAIRNLKPGDAKAIFERLNLLNNTGKLRAEIQSLFSETTTTRPSPATTSASAWGRETGAGVRDQ